MKYITILLFLLLAVSVLANQSDVEATIYTGLVGLGIEDAVVIVNQETTIDYVVPETDIEEALLYQIQAMFVISNKFAPDQPITVIKARYEADLDPVITAAVPNKFTQMLIEGVIDEKTFWGNVELNSKDLLAASNESEKESDNSSSAWVLLVLGVLVGIYFIGKKVQSNGLKKNITVKKRRILNLRLQHLLKLLY